jgi:glycosyltransferase involved in cell wall biosynthesis
MKLSIIVPVYNAEKYLDRTIKNILEQTFTDFELLLIDDGSKDCSCSICDNWSKKDSRIKVIHQENTGVGGARNTGLDIAQGEYIGFVDNDDLIHPQMYEILLGVADKENADIVMSEERKVDEHWDRIASYIEELSISYELLDKRAQFERLFSNSQKDGPYMAIWNKIYRKKMIGNVRFPLTGSEDMVFNSRLFRTDEKFVLIDENINLYYWVQRVDSQSHNSQSGYKSNILKSYFSTVIELSEDCPEYSFFAKEKAMKIVLSTRYNFRNTQFKNQVKKDIKNNIKPLLKTFVSDKRIAFKNKFGLLVFYYLPITYSIFRKINDSVS